MSGRLVALVVDETYRGHVSGVHWWTAWSGRRTGSVAVTWNSPAPGTARRFYRELGYEGVRRVS